jgi:hypothetical protein
VRGGTLAAVVALLLLALAPALGALPARAGAAPADTSYPPLSASLNGPTTVGTLLSVNYTVNATGGPATALNGTVVGSYTYTASFTAENRTGLVLGPATQGVILNGSASLRFTAGNVTEPVTIAVLITSTYQGTNVSQNVTLLVNIVQPFVLSTTLVVGSGAGVAQFHLEVDLDGAAVGQILVPTLTAGTSYPVSYRYVNPGLAPGWHTFTLSLANEHGLVKFASGAEGYSQSFYVAGSPPDNTIWYLTGAVAFVGAILIWTMRVGARRRGKGKK